MTTTTAAGRQAPNGHGPAGQRDPAEALRETIVRLRHVQLRAELALRDITGEAPAPAPADTPADLLRARPDIARAIRDRVLGRLLTAPTDSQRLLLLETLDTWLKTGSPVKAAEELFCSRNTITNRLHRIGRLTGLRLVGGAATPAELAELALAVEAYRILRG